jgi:phospholipid/cholesterol/gamma-HCH transport system substrate-binding protein
VKSAEAKIGAFVVVCAFVLCATVYLVSTAKSSGAKVPYHTYLRDALGIEPGTAVMFGGIAVGKITVVQPDSVDPTRIEIDFVVRQHTPLNAESVAEVGSESLMSSPVLVISTGSNKAARLGAGATIQSRETVSLAELQRNLGELVEAAQPTLAQVSGDLHGVANDTRQLLANLNSVTTDANRRHISNILANTDGMTAELSPRLQQISEQVLDLTKSANVLAAKLGPTVDNVNATVANANATITTIREPTQADLLELQKTLVQTRSLVVSLQALVGTNTQNTNETFENLRMATENINELTESLKQRPWSLVRIKQPKDRKVPNGGGK